MAFWDNRQKYEEEEDVEMSPQEIAQHTRTSLQNAASEILEEVEERVAVKKEKSSISPALLRLEQGKLYQMLIEHDLFADIDAHPQAIENVQNELKDFITSRLEIMLGLRTEKESVVIRNDSVFSQNEIEALKALAKKLTDGVSKKPEEVKTGNLTPVGVDKAKNLIAKMQPKPIQQEKAIKKEPLQKTEKVEVPKKIKKPLKTEITIEDMIERNNQINTKKAEPESAIKLPMPSADMIHKHYESQILSDPNKMAMIQRVLKK
jgi:hypothetical protein